MNTLYNHICVWKHNKTVGAVVVVRVTSSPHGEGGYIRFTRLWDDHKYGHSEDG